MIHKDIEQQLNFVDATRTKRVSFANKVLENPTWIPILLSIAAQESKPFSTKACWVLEFVVRKDADMILPYIKEFVTILPKIHKESSIRPLAKICEIISSNYFSKNLNNTQQTLTTYQLEQIAETCFDWLIGAHKVAPKAYSMNTLFHIGKMIDWIHPELELIISKDYQTGSAAYKARGKHVTEQLKKLRQKK